MARERYLIDQEESSIHSNIITADTKKEKFKNWWYYNKKKLLVCIIAVGVVISFIWSIVTKVEPDYTIALMGGAYVPEDIMILMEEQIAQYGVDCNGDGQVVVDVANYNIATDSSDSSYSAELQEASYVKYMVDMMSGTSMIWIHDDIGYYSMGKDVEEGVFLNLTDGEKPTMMPYGDISALANLDFSDYNGEYALGDFYETEFLKFNVSFRDYSGSIEDKSKVQIYYQQCQELFQNMLDGTKTN